MTTSQCSAVGVTSRAFGAAGLLGFALVTLFLCAALSTRAWAICLDDCIPCHPCNEESVCYDPCSSPSLWCYAAAGCGGAMLGV
jgi:hypothetical protein